jgi:hypothetical protein
VSLKSEEIPQDWKKARITRVYKHTGTNLDKGNYTSISIVGHIAKIIEIQVKNQLIVHLTLHKLITVEQ